MTPPIMGPVSNAFKFELEPPTDVIPGKLICDRVLWENNGVEGPTVALWVIGNERDSRGRETLVLRRDISGTTDLRTVGPA